MPTKQKDRPVERFDSPEELMRDLVLLQRIKQRVGLNDVQKRRYLQLLERIADLRDVNIDVVGKEMLELASQEAPV
jgi:hypothetical protein